LDDAGRTVDTTGGQFSFCLSSLLEQRELINQYWPHNQSDIGQVLASLEVSKEPMMALDQV
jgi:hypothetical protein